MRFCHICGSELKPDATTCAICGTPVAGQPQAPAQQPEVAAQPQAPIQQPAAPNPPKQKKKKKNLGLKITAAVLAFVILAVSGLFIADYVMYKEEIEAAEHITDFPVLKIETDFVVFDEELFPSTNYSIKVERVLYGGILKSDMFKQTKIIIDDESTEPVYHIDFEEEGKYIITLEDETKKENAPQYSTDTDFSTSTDFSTATDTDNDDDDKPNKIIIEVTVDDSDEDAVGSVNLNSKPGDKPAELPTTDDSVIDTDSEPVITPNIPSDAYEYNGHYYMLYTDVCDTWEEAEEYCKNLGGHLAVISSQAENDALYSYIISVGNGNAYFGYTDNREEGNWYWVEGESSYTNWHSGEPNSESYENYAMFYYQFDDGTWNDGNFDNGTMNDSKNFICEWDVQDSTDNTQTSTSEWVGAYRHFMTYYDVNVQNDDNLGFMLCYINNDDIPELIVGLMPEYAHHGAAAKVFTYYNGNVSYVCDGGQYGGIEFSERENMICSMYAGMGTVNNFTYEISNGDGVCIWTGFNNIGNVVEDEDIVYESNSITVSKDEYNESLDRYYPTDRLKNSSDYYHLLTDENISTYITE